MDSKHTPGPWRLGYEDGSGVADDYTKGYCITAGERTVVYSGDSFGVLYGIEREADARLISSAPELLAALEKAAERMDVYAEWASREIIASRGTPVLREVAKCAKANADRARTALRKARGED